MNDGAGSVRGPEVTSRRLLAARNGVAVAFVLNGFAFATWVSRIPEVRTLLGLTPGALGTLLLALSGGAVVALPASGVIVHRLGAARVVAGGAGLVGSGLVLAGLGAGALQTAWVAAVGMFVMGFGTGSWDVAMNVEGAAVERDLGRTVMPRFHAGFSLGTVVGAGVGAACAALGVPVAVHLTLGAGLAVGVTAAAVRSFLPATSEDDGQSGPRRNPLRGWAEPRTVAIGLMVLAMALTEGTANDWLAVALVDGYDVVPAVGAAGFALFVAAMTLGRVAGTALLDRYGRLPVLWGTMALAAAGVLVVVLGGSLAVAAVGVALWGLGASLGFPVGMSAAADDAEHAAARVSVVSTIGYTAFLAGPPLLGYLGDHVGTLRALLVVAVLVVPSMAVVPAARPPARPLTSRA